MEYSHIRLHPRDSFTVLILHRPERRNALSAELMRELLHALDAVAESKSRGVLLEAAGPVFSAGHDFADMAGRDLAAMRTLLGLCARLMQRIQAIPQPVLAKVHGLATAAGCQLVASCDLAVASSEASFATPGGRGGWFCTTPAVALGRSVGRKRALEMLMTGDSIDAETAAGWGLVNRVVAPEQLDSAAWELLRRATRGSRFSKGLGKQAFYAQLDLDQPRAYDYALEVMAAGSQHPDAVEGIRAFLEKRRPVFED